MDCCVEHEKEQKLGRLLDEMATERTNKVITMLFFLFLVFVACLPFNDVVPEMELHTEHINFEHYSHNFSQVLVFTETKRKCDELTRNMRRHG